MATLGVRTFTVYLDGELVEIPEWADVMLMDDIDESPYRYRLMIGGYSPTTGEKYGRTIKACRLIRSITEDGLTRCDLYYAKERL